MIFTLLLLLLFSLFVQKVCSDAISSFLCQSRQQRKEGYSLPKNSSKSTSITALLSIPPLKEYSSCSNAKGNEECPMDSSQNVDATSFVPNNIVVVKEEETSSSTRKKKLGLEFSFRVILCVISFIIFISLVCTFCIPVENDDVPSPWNKVSVFIGWMYFCLWSVSFVPQLIINLRRHSVVGQSVDFIALNIFGFSCLAVYTFSFYALDDVKSAYANRHHGETSTVTLNDVCFAVWALSASALNAIQVVYYYRAPNQVVTGKVKYGLTILFGIIIIWWVSIIFFGSRETPVLNTLDLLYGLSCIKLGITCVKYLPQLYMNYKRQATSGWSIENVLCDFGGGSLSVTQQLMDSFFTKKMDGLLGNPVKFFLGSLSIVYDVLFMIQHFILYRGTFLIDDVNAAPLGTV